MPAHLKSVGIGFVTGLAAFMIFVFVAEGTQSDDTGLIGYCVAALAAGFWSGRQNQKSILYAGAVINFPAWFLFIGPADPGQFQEHLVGLIVGVISAYIGSFLGARFTVPTQAGRGGSHADE